MSNNISNKFDWIKQNPEILFFMHTFNARIVGGAVRNTLMNIPNVGEIDLATPFTPDEMIYISDIMKLKHIPTGISHGTITVLSRRYSQSYLTYIREILQNIQSDTSTKLSDIQQAIKNSCEFLIHHYEQMQNLPAQVYEFTTLRDDVETDGRHAKIRYTKDWQTDADRRDFTINALYVDVNLQIHDLVNGTQDIHNSFIRFVGTPSLRIQEDYLRILRFFRFNSHYGSDNYDQEALNACKNNVNGLKQISQERLFAEFNKLLKGKNALLAIEKMDEAGIFITLNWPKVNPEHLNVYRSNLSLLNSAYITHLQQYNAQIHTENIQLFQNTQISSSVIIENTQSHHAHNTQNYDSTHASSFSQDISLAASIDQHSNAHNSAHVSSSAITVAAQSHHTSTLLSSLIHTSLISEALFSTFNGSWSDLKMPKKTLQIIQSLQKTHPQTLSEWYTAFYHHDIEWIHAKILTSPNLSIDTILSLLEQFQHEFIFPIAGKDILEFCEAGPRIGALYTDVLNWWLQGLCKASFDECMTYLKSIL